MMNFEGVKYGMDQEALHYDSLHALAFSYNLWCEEKGYPCLSMDEQDLNAMPKEDRITISQYILLWEALDK